MSKLITNAAPWLDSEALKKFNQLYSCAEENGREEDLLELKKYVLELIGERNKLSPQEMGAVKEVYRGTRPSMIVDGRFFDIVYGQIEEIQEYEDLDVRNEGYESYHSRKLRERRTEVQREFEKESSFKGLIGLILKKPSEE